MKIEAAKRLIASDIPPLKIIDHNPRGRWLEEKRRYVKEQPRDQWGAPVFGSETATLNRPALMPVAILRDIKGRRGEQYNVRTDALQWLEKHMRNHRLPPSPSGGDYIPYIQVDYTGKPWVNEGNHRIMTAYKLGYKCLPVQIVWFTGGEEENDIHGRPPRALSPALVLAADKEALRLGFTFDNYATHRNTGDRE
jgi:hypothetical protein